MSKLENDNVSHHSGVVASIVANISNNPNLEAPNKNNIPNNSNTTNNVNNIFSDTNSNQKNNSNNKNVPPIPTKKGIPIPPPFAIGGGSKKPKPQENKNQVPANPEISSQLNEQDGKEYQPMTHSTQPLSFKDVLNSRMGGGNQNQNRIPQQMEVQNSNQNPILNQPTQSNQSNQPKPVVGLSKQNNFISAPPTGIGAEDDDEDEIFKVSNISYHKKIRNNHPN